MKLNYSLFCLSAGVFMAFLISSCADVRKTVYFVDQNDAAVPSTNVAPLTYIQPNDILSITVSSLNPAATNIFNAPNNSYVATNTAGTNGLQSPGYLVNNDGAIQFPIIGDIKASGLTTNQLRLQITRQLVDKKLAIDPIVSIRQLNFKVSVLGEVGRPTVVNVPSEKISLLEALGFAGDINVTGRKDNVMVIREENGTKKITRINLNSNELFSSPYYYLKSNDIVYVEANRAKVASASRSTQLLPIILSSLSLVAIIVSAIYTNN